MSGDGRNALATRPRDVRNMLAEAMQRHAVDADPLTRGTRKVRDFILDNLTTQGSPAEQVAQAMFPDYRSSNTAGIWANEPDMGSMAAGMAGPLQMADFLYHVTPRSNARAIASEGLRPDAPKIGEGGPHGDTRAVFLADEATVPVYQDLYGAGGEPLSTFRVPRSALQAIEEDAASEGTAYMTRDRIPPTALEVETAHGWMPVVRRRR
jgi:hypothetical protein